MKPNMTIIPAHPGTRLLLADADARDFCALPIVAWSCTPPHEGRAGRAEPVTASGDDADLSAHAWAIGHGCGLVEVPGAAVFTTTAAWLADLREHAHV